MRPAALRERLVEWNQERRLRYHGYAAQLWIRLRRPAAYEQLSLDDVRRQRRADTLFIIGSGPSIQDVTPAQWAHVSRHDSFGINFSFLLDFVPTYHIMEDGKAAWHRTLTRELLAPRRGKLAPSIWFISDRHTRRLIHPRYTPELFPDPARVCVFRMPPRLLLDRDRPLDATDFARGIRYRGTMSLVLALASDLGYARIVMLGVDPQTPRHFFDALPEMQPYRDNVRPEQLDDREVFAMMRPKGTQYRPLDEYLYGLNELHFRPRGATLHVGTPACVFAARLPVYDRWDA